MGYRSLSAYTDDDTAVANNLLLPRYAESDPTSSPPSPASIESFDVLDSIPWRRSYISLDSGSSQDRRLDRLRKRCRGKKTRIVAILLLFILFVTGCTLGGYLAVKHEKDKLKDNCYARNGGDRCAELTWARCVARNGFGYCEGFM
ncbi:hypothetical protein BKA66DRAFT_449281 [Pyrenochaeta sp. MPI-SDFR-AT-0127]|nr:hypothetical protein BKA66DRAFT_449281 [Pyrenochaeta sp. MPI-SDFR-AT-0127]